MPIVGTATEPTESTDPLTTFFCLAPPSTPEAFV